ncbi:MAG: cysteine hydrolase [Sphingobium sp.]
MHRIAVPAWAVERGRDYNCFDHIDPPRTALVVIDMQTVFIAEGEVFGNPHARDIMAPVNRLVHAMRVAGSPVIWTRQTVSDEPPLAMPTWQYDLNDPHVRRAVEVMRAGTPSHNLYPAMACEAGDVVLDKYRYGAFMCPAGALAAALIEMPVDMLIIVGTLTNVCVESTARDANMLGYKVIVVPDATATITDEEHNAALLNLCLNFADLKTVDELLALL